MQAVSLSLHKKLAGAHHPSPCGLDDADIMSAALYMHPGLSTPQGWLEKVVTAKGGIITQGNNDYSDAPLLVADGQASFVIFMPPEPGVTSRGQSWFIALALAHMTLHWPPPSQWGSYSDLLYVPVSSREGDMQEARRQASKFAIELLMPEEVFFYNYKIGTPYAETATKLGIDVHEDIIRYRAQMMGYK